MQKSCQHFARLTAALLLMAGRLSAQEAQARLHFKPHDHALGDVHPFFKEGECFLYYLKPGKYDSALVRSHDWLHWNETAVTHTPVQPEDWMAPYFVLGVLHDAASQQYRSFYGHAGGRMVSSESRDLLHWSCAPKTFQIPPADYYQRRRDPFVFWMPEMQQFGCVMTTQLKGRPKNKAGAISFATSPDLQQWQDHGPLVDPGTIGEPECPQMFHLGKRWYLLASIYDRAVGQPVYWSSDQPLGPWGKEPAGKLDGKDLCAAQIAFDGDTPMLFGWIPLTASKPGQQPWGGHLALPREVIALPDGTLGTRLPEKLAKRFAALPWKTFPNFTLSRQPHELTGQWQRLAIQFNLRLPAGTNEMRVRFGQHGEVVLQRSELRVLDAQGECWSQLPAQLPVAEPFSVQLFIDDGIVELFVGQRYSLAARLPVSISPLQLQFQSDGTAAAVTALQASELLLPP